jgi:dipeptidyl aminopeptidase/acylaminoacyl peptidase
VLVVALSAAMILAGAWWVAQPDRRSPVLSPASLHFVPAPRRLDVSSLAWDPFRRRLVASAVTGGGGDRPAAHLFALTSAGRAVEAVRTAQDPNCDSTEQLDPQPLRDGRIVYLQFCRADGLEPNRINSVWVFDQRRGSTQRFRPYSLGLWPTTLAVSSDGRQGMFAGGSLSYAHLYTLSPNRLTRLRAPVSFARDIAWTNDGRRLAIGAVPSWHDGWDIFVAHPWRIYVGDRAGTEFRALPLRLTSETNVSWSPNGRWLAFVSSPAGQNRGLWGVEVATGKTVFLVADKDLKSPTWLPDGRLLALRFAPNLGSSNGYYTIPRTSLDEHGIHGT